MNMCMFITYGIIFQVHHQVYRFKIYFRNLKFTSGGSKNDKELNRLQNELEKANKQIVREFRQNSNSDGKVDIGKVVTLVINGFLSLNVTCH